MFDSNPSLVCLVNLVVLVEFVMTSLDTNHTPLDELCVFQRNCSARRASSTIVRQVGGNASRGHVPEGQTSAAEIQDADEAASESERE